MHSVTICEIPPEKTNLIWEYFYTVEPILAFCRESWHLRRKCAGGTRWVAMKCWHTRRCCGAVWSGIAAVGTTKHWVTRAATDCVLNAGTKTRPDLWRLGSRALSVDMTPANERVNRLSRVDCHHRSDWLLPVCKLLSVTDSASTKTSLFSSKFVAFRTVY